MRKVSVVRVPVFPIGSKSVSLSGVWKGDRGKTMVLRKEIIYVGLITLCGSLASAGDSGANSQTTSRTIDVALITSKEQTASFAKGRLSVLQAMQALDILINEELVRETLITRLEVKNAEVRWLAEGIVSIGPWRCDLQQCTFGASLESSIAFKDYSGFFRRQKGKWIAVLSRTRETHPIVR